MYKFKHFSTLQLIHILPQHLLPSPQLLILFPQPRDLGSQPLDFAPIFVPPIVRLQNRNLHLEGGQSILHGSWPVPDFAASTV